MNHTLIGLLLFCFFTGPSLAAPAAEPPLIMGVFPRHNATETVRMFNPLAGYLSKKLGRKVQLETSKDFPSFWQGVADQHYDLVHYNQLHYIKSHEEFGYEVIVMNEEDGASTIAGEIVARKDRGIHELRDLKGKKIMFGGDKTALMAYIIPTLLLRKAGLRDQDYDEEFAKNPPNALLAAYFQQADAAGVGDVVMSLPDIRRQADTSKLMVLGKSEPVPHLPWATNKNMAPALREKIRSILVDLRNSAEGQKILKAANLTGLVSADDKDYDPIKNIMHQMNAKH
jgi:phosphonate transport system substrate-binding protein